MGIIKKFVNGLYKFAFGIDVNKQQKYIDTLEFQVKNLKKSNILLKEQIEVQRQMLFECNENLKRILTSMNKLITFKLYFGVEGRNNQTCTSFEFAFTGIVPKLYDIKQIATEFEREQLVRDLLYVFKITWLDYNSIVGLSKGGLDCRLIEGEPTESFNVGLTIDGTEVGAIEKWFNDYQEY